MLKKSIHFIIILFFVTNVNAGDFKQEDRERLGRVETRVGKLEVRVGKLDDRVGKVEDRLGKIEEELGKVKVRLGKLEVRVDEGFKSLKAQISDNKQNTDIQIKNLQKQTDEIRQEVRDLSIKTENEFKAVRAEFKAIRTEVKQDLKAIRVEFKQDLNELKDLFYWGFGLLLTSIIGLVAVMIGLILWDRGTLLKKVEKRLKVLEETVAEVIEEVKKIKDIIIYWLKKDPDAREYADSIGFQAA